MYAAGSQRRLTKFSLHLTRTLAVVTPCRAKNSSLGGWHLYPSVPFPTHWT